MQSIGTDRERMPRSTIRNAQVCVDGRDDLVAPIHVEYGIISYVRAILLVAKINPEII